MTDVSASIARVGGYPADFPRNQWYVAGHSDEFDGELMSRRLLGIPVCFYRTSQGNVVALEDRCLHRQMPLSKGRLRDDNLECGYHGIVYAQDGRAIEIPSQTHVPPACRVAAYPLREVGGLVWIWLGDPARADDSLIAHQPWLTEPGWTVVRGTLHMNARAQLINENLLDLSHVQFLHVGSIGADDVAAADVVVEFDERTVRVTRAMDEAISPPLFVAVMGLEGQIERHQVAEFIAPGLHVTHLTARQAGAAEGEPSYRHKAVHCITPETRNTAHYFWLVSRDYNTDSDQVSQLFQEGIPKIFLQDIEAVEAIEGVLAIYAPEYPTELNIKVDAGPLRARHIIERMVGEERALADQARMGEK